MRRQLITAPAHFFQQAGALPWEQGFDYRVHTGFDAGNAAHCGVLLRVVRQLDDHHELVEYRYRNMRNGYELRPDAELNSGVWESRRILHEHVTESDWIAGPRAGQKDTREATGIK